MNEFLLILSAICFILPAQIIDYNQKVNGGFSLAYSSPIYKYIVTGAKYFSILPVFIAIYAAGYGEMAWYFKIIIWALFYLIVKIFGTWLFDLIFGIGKGGAKTSTTVLIVGIVTFVIALII